MEIKIGVYHTTNNNGEPLDLHTQRSWSPGDDGYLPFNPAWPGEPSLHKHGRERAWSLKGVLRDGFTGDMMMFESDVIAYLERNGYEFEEA